MMEKFSIAEFACSKQATTDLLSLLLLLLSLGRLGQSRSLFIITHPAYIIAMNT